MVGPAGFELATSCFATLFFDIYRLQYFRITVYRYFGMRSYPDMMQGKARSRWEFRLCRVLGHDSGCVDHESMVTLSLWLRPLYP